VELYNITSSSPRLSPRSIGGVEVFKGEVSESGNENFVIELADGSGSLTVSLSEDTLIHKNCNDIFDGTVIPVGAHVKVAGKFITGDNVNIFQAVIVLFKYQVIDTLLTEISDIPDDSEYHLTIQHPDDSSKIYYLAEDTLVKLKGDGPIDINDLKGWVACQSRPVVFEIFDNDLDPPEISKLIILADELTSTVMLNEDDSSSILTSHGKVDISNTATIFKYDGDKLILIEKNKIEDGNHVKFYGINACDDDDISFYAYIVFVIPSDDIGEAYIVSADSIDNRVNPYDLSMN